MLQHLLRIPYTYVRFKQTTYQDTGSKTRPVIAKYMVDFKHIQ